MNCKPGDMAVIVRSAAGNEGRIVTCIEIASIESHAVFRDYGPVWRIAELVESVFSGKQNLVMDAYLRPIRPQADDAQDESKAWLPPVPTKEHA